MALIALVTLFIFGALPLAYIFSFLAKKPTSAFSSFCVLTILTGTATLTLVSLYELKYEHTASTAFKLAFTAFREYYNNPNSTDHCYRLRELTPN